MGDHKLSNGIRLIQGIESLGRILEYHVEREFPLSAHGINAAQAVDVAWFEGPTQTYPLMIFEIESRAGNTIANNPLKVFAQDNRQFEKPLFFFHILASGGRATARLAQLERQYGTYNYRLYRVSEHECTTLIKDILTQHRRISTSIDYVSLYGILRSTEWLGLVDASAVVDHAYELGLERHQLLPSLIRLARRHDEVLELLPRRIEAEQHSGWAGMGRLASSWGQIWGPMILSSWMSGRAESVENRELWDSRLTNWQNNASFMPMFSSALSLSSDYAEFMLSGGGPFVALVVGLARARGTFGRELCGILLDSLWQLQPDWRGLQLAAWILHISARLNMRVEYDRARKFVDSAGGLAVEDLTTPPSWVNTIDSDRDHEFRPWDGGDCPRMDDLLQIARRVHTHCSSDRACLMLAVLDEQQFPTKFNEDVLGVLWQPAPENQVSISQSNEVDAKSSY